MKIDKRKFYGTIFGSIAFIAVILMFTYARYVWKSDESALSFSISDEFFYCESGKTDTISKEDGLKPTLDYRVDSAVETFMVSNIGKDATTFSVSLNITSIDNSLKSSDFKYQLVVDKSGGSNVCSNTSVTSCEEVAEGDFSNAKVGMNTLAETVELPSNVKYQYYLFIYIAGNAANATAMQNSSMNFTLDVCEVVVFFDYNGGTGNKDFLKVTSTYDGLPSATHDDIVITYNTNGGGSVSNNTVGYNFDAWYLDSNSTNTSEFDTKIVEDAAVTKKTNHTLHAKWNPSETSGTSNDGCVVLPSVTKSGYSFGGWYSDSGLTTKKGNAGDSYCVKPEDSSHTLYAKWTANAYKLTVKPNGGTWNGSTSDQEFTQNFGTTKTIAVPSATPYYTISYNVNGGTSTTPSNKPASRAFTGWTLAGSGSITSNTPIATSSQVYTYGAGDGTLTASYNATANSIQTASVEKKYTITYNTNNTGATSSKTSDTISYTMNGWYTAASGGTKRASNGGNYQPTKTETLYAQWGSASTVTLPTLTRTGYECTWNTEANGSGTSYNPGATGYTNEGNKTLYAVCERTQVTVTYYKGSTSIGTSTHTYNESSALTTWANLGQDDEITNSDATWTFVGWSESPNAVTLYKPDGGSITLTEDKSLYAVYTRNVTFKSGVSAGTSTTVGQLWNPAGTTNGTHVTAVTSPALTAVTNWTAEGYRYDTTAGDKESALSAGASIYPSVSKSNTLYGVYSRTITFYSGEKGTVEDGGRTQYLNCNNNTTSSIGMYTPSSISGWTALGYRSDTTASTGYSSGATVTPAYTTDNVFAAVYSRTFSATFKSGINAATSTTKTSGSVYYNADPVLAATLPTSSTVTPPTATAITDWTVAGWSTSNTGTTTTSACPTSGNCTVSGQTYYAIYSRAYSYNFYSLELQEKTDKVEGTVYYNTDTDSLPTGVVITTPTPGAITDWTALGWRTDNEETTAAYSSNASTGTAIPFGTSFNAVYSRTFTALFVSGINMASYVPYESDIVYYNSGFGGLYTSAAISGNITAPEPAAITNWTALGWRDDTTASTAEFEAGVTCTSSVCPARGNSTNPTRYYAVYSRSYTATFYSGVNKATTATATSDTVYYNTNTSSTPTTVTITTESLNSSEIEALTAIFFKAKGWSITDGSTSVSCNSSSSCTVSWGTNFYAVYSVRYQAAFHSGIDGETEVWGYSDSFNYSSSNTLPSTATATALSASACTDIEYWTELGWRDDTTAGNKEIDFGGTFNMKANGEYYAVYSRVFEMRYEPMDITFTLTVEPTVLGNGLSPTQKTIYMNSNSSGTLSSFTITMSEPTITDSSGVTHGFEFDTWRFGYWRVRYEGTSTSTYEDVNKGASYTATTALVPYNADTFYATAYARWNSNVFVVQDGFNSSNKKGYYTALKDAIAAADETTYKYIFQLKDRTETTTENITINKSITLSTNGYDLTIQKALIVADGVTFKKRGGGTLSSAGRAFTVRGTGNLYIQYGTVTSTGAYNTIYNEGSGNVVIEGGTVTHSTPANAYYSVRNAADGRVIIRTATLEGGSLDGTATTGKVTGYGGVYNVTGTYRDNSDGVQVSSVYLNGGTIAPTGEGAGIYNYAGGRIYIDSGKITSDTRAFRNCGVNCKDPDEAEEPGTIVMYGGTITCGAITCIRNDVGSTVAIYGGTVTSERVALYNADYGNLYIGHSGGNYTATISGTGSGYPAVYCGNSDIDGGSQAYCQAQYGSVISATASNAILNNGGDFRIYDGAKVSTSSETAAAILNKETEYYAQSADESISGTARYWGRVFVRGGWVDAVGSAISSYVAHNYAISIGSSDDTLVNTHDGTISRYNGPYVRGTGADAGSGVYVHASGYTYRINNGVVFGNKAASYTTPITTRSGHTITAYSGTTYNYFYLKAS